MVHLKDEVLARITRIIRKMSVFIRGAGSNRGSGSKKRGCGSHRVFTGRSILVMAVEVTVHAQPLPHTTRTCR